jgi:hypothetical protein
MQFCVKLNDMKGAWAFSHGSASLILLWRSINNIVALLYHANCHLQGLINYLQALVP